MIVPSSFRDHLKSLRSLLRTQNKSGRTVKNNCLCHVLTHICNKQWVNVMCIVASESDPDFFEGKCSCNSPMCFIARNQEQASLLHIICSSDPPSPMVDIVIEKYPPLLSYRDHVDRLPLHIACQYGASPEVIRLLIGCHMRACMEKDAVGKLPLHIACENYVEWSRLYMSRNQANRCLMTVIRNLIEVYPISLLVEDNKGMCPLEYALLSKAEDNVVNCLREKSELIRERFGGKSYVARCA